jgi:hypothetical protein
LRLVGLARVGIGHVVQGLRDIVAARAAGEAAAFVAERAKAVGIVAGHVGMRGTSLAIGNVLVREM